jgi:hypothetical protein
MMLGTPGDVLPERNCVEEVVASFNRPGGAAAQRNLRLELVEGNHSPVPGMGRPQKLVFDQIPAETWDLFVGVLWQRFGTPTGGLNPRTSRPLESGTQEEFEEAYQAYLKTGKPRILIYRCLRPNLLRPHEIDTDQLGRLNKFFNQFSAAGEHPGFFKTFEELTQLQRELSHDLSLILEEFDQEPFEERPENLGPSDSPATAEARSDRLVIKLNGAAPVASSGPEPMSLLMVDVAGHSEILEKFGPDGAVLLNAFEATVRRIATDWGGMNFSWEGDGGIFGFSGVGRQYRAAMAGIEIRQMLPVLHLNRAENPALIKFEIRSTAHDGAVQLESQKGSIHSPAVNLVAHLLKHGTEAGEFLLTQDLVSCLEPPLQGKLFFKGRYHDQAVYVYPQPLREAPPARPALAELLVEVRREVTRLIGLVNHGTSHPTRTNIQSMRIAIDGIYSAVQRFLTWCDSFDDRWAASYLAEIRDCASVFLESDRHLLEAFKLRLRTFPEGVGQPLDLLQISDFLAHRRRWLMVRVEKVWIRLQQQLEGVSPIAWAPDEWSEPLPEVRNKVERLATSPLRLEADDLFAELASNHRRDFARLIADSTDRMLIDRLWTSVDLLLVEDLRCHPSFRWNHGQALFQAALRNPVDPTRFRLLQQFLATPGSAIPELLRAQVDPSLEQGLWKGLLVGHPAPEIRRQAIGKLEPIEVWPVLAHPEVPLWVILEAIQHLSREETREGVAQQQRQIIRDRQKVLFDCTRSRIQSALISFVPGEFEEATAVLRLFYGCAVFAEKAYWRRLEILGDLFSLRAPGRGASSDALAKARAWLADRRGQAADMTFPKAPSAVRELPPGVQRQLARRGHYLDFFVTQDDALAFEAQRFLGPDYLVHLLLETRNFNPRLLQRLSVKPFCGAKVVRHAILRHRACPLTFAEHARQVGLEEVQHLYGVRHELSDKVRSIVDERVRRLARVSVS